MVVEWLHNPFIKPRFFRMTQLEQMFTKFCTVQLGYKSMFKLWDDNHVFCLMKKLNIKLLERYYGNVS